MRLTIKEPEINIGVDGFEGHCQLGRAETGKKLSELVEKIEDPIVIALDGSWGSGKSFFLKCWTGAHTKENGGKAKVIYFDAFQHDFLDDPLIALTGVLADQFDSTSKAGKAIGAAKKAVSKMWRPASRIGLAAATAGTSEIVGAVGDAAIATSSKELSKASENFWKKEDGRRAAMGEFQNALEKLTGPDKEGASQKIVIIIDELDRCRPDYALTMLEVIKHFFAVDNVHFVLGVNLKELRNSVRARYGAGVDAENYLRKFIHLGIQLPNDVSVGLRPQTAPRKYFSILADHHSLSKELADIANNYLMIIGNESANSLRILERLATILVLIPKRFETQVPGYKVVIVGAAIIKTLSPDLYSELLLGTASIGKIEKFLSLTDCPKEAQRPAEYYHAAWQAFLAPDDYKARTKKYNGLFGTWGYEGEESELSEYLKKYLETFDLVGDSA